MTNIQPDLAILLPDLYSAESRAAAPPEIEELLAYLEGELSPEEEDALQERLALHPEATRLLLDLTDPSRLEEQRSESLLLADVDALRQQLRDEGSLKAPKAPVVLIRRGGHTAYRWATAALLVVSVGLGLELASQRESSPLATADIALWELLPRTGSGERGASEVVEAEPGFIHDLVLYSDKLEPGVVYRATAVDAEGREVFSRALRTRVRGRAILRLGEDDLAFGRYEIRLGPPGDPEPPMAVFDLEWRRP